MKILRFLFSPVFMGALLILLAVSMAAATFLENDYGSGAAYATIYNAWWFELIFVALAVNLTGQLFINNMFRKSRLPVALFHLAFIIMIIGAGITRYTGWEGIMHIREGEEENICYSSEKYLGYSVVNDAGESLAEYSEKFLIHSGRQEAIGKEIRINDREFRLELAGIMNNAEPANSNERVTGQRAFVFHLYEGEKSNTLLLWDKDNMEAAEVSFSTGGVSFNIRYGSETITLPFALRLNDFVLERYPGSDSPSGYKSMVTLYDREENIEMPFVIYMNNVLKYRGFRFYQSSYDNDEEGTVLSVSHDPAGMIVTYTGYALLFLFIVLSLTVKHSQFRNIRAGSWFSPLRKKVVSVILFLLFAGIVPSYAGDEFIPGKKSANELGKILVQDQKGRTKPLSTLSGDILRKVSRETRFNGLTSQQVFLGIYFDFDNWKDVPLIKVSDRALQKYLGIKGNYATFTNLVDLTGDGTYRLSGQVKNAYSKSPSERSRTDKEVMKVDERLNIVYMIYRGEFLKIFPMRDSTHSWGSRDRAILKVVTKEEIQYLDNIRPLMAEALRADDMNLAREVVVSVRQYQERFSEYPLPSGGKVRAELIYNRLSVFEKLFPFYTTFGLVMLIGLIAAVIKGKKESSWLMRITLWHLVGAFFFHTTGLALRWYISGHSPMSNGYESMIFISWVTLLAGFIFRRRSAFALSATAILAGLTLMVAHLSFMDPEITNLVPVLKSYWLTLHVSVITGSYGFLGLGAITGIISMILLSLMNTKNRERISETLDELTVINFKTLTLGLYFLTIGTFLGAIWANESWGRYWGWDPKETWSLITIIVYTFILHSRMIPGMKDIYSFNLLSLFGFFSVIMTYFGVNYYLSGLHSYAGGDQVPVPGFVYVTVTALIVLSVSAYIKYNKFIIPEKE